MRVGHRAGEGAMFDLVLGAIVAEVLAAYLVYALLHPDRL